MTQLTDMFIVQCLHVEHFRNIFISVIKRFVVQVDRRRKKVKRNQWNWKRFERISEAQHFSIWACQYCRHIPNLRSGAWRERH